MTSAVPHQSGPAGPIPAGIGDLVGRYDVILCDLWGVMHDGHRCFPAAVDAMRRFRDTGGTVVFITNAPRPSPPIIEQIAGLGIPDAAYDGMVTSGDVTIAALIEQGDRPFFHIGPPRDLALFDAMQRQTGRAPVLTDLDQAEVVVVTGLFDDRTETPDHYAAALSAAKARDLLMVCANPDIVVHVGDTLIYCGGALAEAYAQIGGRTLLAGKPHPPIYAAALALAARRRGSPTPPERVLAIGDALVTDVAGAARQGIDIVFITSGIHRDEFHPGPDPATDEALYAGRVAALEHPPLAALPALVW